MYDFAKRKKCESRAPKTFTFFSMLPFFKKAEQTKLNNIQPRDKDIK